MKAAVRKKLQSTSNSTWYFVVPSSRTKLMQSRLHLPSSLDNSAIKGVKETPDTEKEEECPVTSDEESHLQLLPFKHHDCTHRRSFDTFFLLRSWNSGSYVLNTSKGKHWTPTLKNKRFMEIVVAAGLKDASTGDSKSKIILLNQSVQNQLSNDGWTPTQAAPRQMGSRLNTP